MNAIIQAPTNNLFDSLIFYKKIGFKIVSDGDDKILSDGKAVVLINEDRHARAGVRLYRSDWTDTVQSLKEETMVIETSNDYIISDPSGTLIYLITADKAPELELSEIPSPAVGQYAGVGIESISIEKSMKIWNVLGFTQDSGSAEQGWVSMKNKENFSISIMKLNTCPHLFFNPSLIYFNGAKNLEVIQEIRDVRIPITEEITHFNKEGIVDNIIIRDPGGVGFFLFSD